MSSATKIQTTSSSLFTRQKCTPFWLFAVKCDCHSVVTNNTINNDLCKNRDYNFDDPEEAMIYTRYMPINWTTIYRKFRGLWVALKDDEKTVIASGKTAKSALLKAKKKGFEMPILTHIPKEVGNYVG